MSPLELEFKARILDWIRGTIAKVTGCDPAGISIDDKLPEARAQLMAEVLSHTENPGFCPYTGEALTVNELATALTEPGSKLKWLRMEQILQPGDQLHVWSGKLFTPFGKEVPGDYLIAVKVVMDDALMKRTGLSARTQFTSLISGQIDFSTGSVPIAEVNSGVIITVTQVISTACGTITQQPEFVHAGSTLNEPATVAG